MGDDGRAVLFELDGPVARITLNRPEVLNAENFDWVVELERAVTLAEREPQVRILLIAGAGRAFSSGLDRDMVAKHGWPSGFFEKQEAVFRRLELMDRIVVCALHGYCLGGGLQLAISCDIRICSTDSRLGTSAVHYGLFPGMASYRLPRLIGAGPTARLLLSGETIEAGEAARLGLVDHVVPAERFREGVEELVGRYLQASQPAAAAVKRLMHRDREPFDVVFDDSLRMLRECLDSPDFAAGNEAWKQRRRG
jgi:enoyl-CoA hydratase/carnithine racemase